MATGPVEHTSQLAQYASRALRILAGLPRPTTLAASGFLSAKKADSASDPEGSPGIEDLDRPGSRPFALPFLERTLGPHDVEAFGRNNLISTRSLELAANPLGGLASRLHHETQACRVDFVGLESCVECSHLCPPKGFLIEALERLGDGFRWTKPSSG